MSVKAKNRVPAGVGYGGTVYETANKEFTLIPLFRDCCERAGVSPTARQASKWRNGKGAALAVHNQRTKDKSKETQ